MSCDLPSKEKVYYSSKKSIHGSLQRKAFSTRMSCNMSNTEIRPRYSKDRIHWCVLRDTARDIKNAKCPSLRHHRKETEQWTRKSEE